MVRAFIHNLVPRAHATGLEKEEPPGPTSIFTTSARLDRMVELIPPEASVLDFGCGTRRLLARLKHASARKPRLRNTSLPPGYFGTKVF